MENFISTYFITQRIKWCFIFTICILSLTSIAQTPQFDWVQNSNTYFRSNTYDVEVDQQGNIFYSGSFSSTVDFDPGPGIAIASTPFSALVGMFVVKLDSNKNFLWVKTIVNSNYFDNYKMKLDTQGNLLFIGINSGADADFDPGPDTLYSNYSSYMLKWDNNGNFL